MVVKREAPVTSILFISVGNPLGIGLVGSLGRPGANVTGFSDNLAELSRNYVQFATELGVSPGVVHSNIQAGGMGNTGFRSPSRPRGRSRSSFERGPSTTSLKATRP
jgi:hypothetical protein